MPPNAVAQGLAFLRGGGAMGALIRSMDWSRHPLGPAERWPQSLKTSVSICLDSGFPVLLWWGPDLLMLYNDAYRPILGDKHPRSLGQAGRACWPEIWDTIGPMLQDVLARGSTSYFEDLMLPLHRRGFAEECYFTFTYSPIRDESGEVGGVFCAVTETTQRVYGERQVACLRDLAAATADARTYEAVGAATAGCLARYGRDVPLALLYLADTGRSGFSLAAAAGVSPGSAAGPEALRADADRPWPVGEVHRTQRAVLVDVPAGAAVASPTAARRAVVLPVAPSGCGGKGGVLVAGVNPMRALDDVYRGFLDLAAGEIAAAVANAQAWEEERRRAEALAELDRAKTAFFSEVSHEFRTPLTLLLGPVEDALRGGALERRQLELVHRNGVRLLRLVNTLLEFARLEASRTDAVYRPTDLAAATAELASNFRSAVERAGLRLVVDCPPLPEPVFVDAGMWEKIVLNLLSNAFKFTFEGEIAVALRWTGAGAELTVRDTGIGIPAAELDHVFERFHRVRAARARSIEGSGIGLALVRELVRLHAGEISVASREGAGTTFRVVLPSGTAHLPRDRVGVARRDAPGDGLAAAAFVEEMERWLPEEAAPRAPGREACDADAPVATRPRVLVADDNADMRAYLGGVLGRHFAVETASDGAAALASVQRSPPDLIVTDVMMPGVDGFELLRRLRADPATREIPIVMLSARAGEEARVEGAAAGADDYLVKPFSARELVARVRTHLELSAMRREATRAMREADARKDAFLAVLSHELRNPLAAVRNAITVVARAEPGSAPARRALEILDRQAGHLARMVDDLLDISRIASGKVELRLARLDARDVARRACADARALFEQRGVALTAVHAPEPLWVEADAARLVQMIGNLLHNALKFTPPGGRVAVEARPSAGACELRVSDDGMGIAPGDLQRIFAPFVQAERTRAHAQGGMGIGLALVRELAASHGGAVRAESAGTGRGATFVLQLPLAAAPASCDPPAAPSPADAGPRPLRVLLVEDDEDAGATLSELLGLDGHEVELAASGRAGLAAAAARHPDVVICDLGLPDLSGHDVVRALRRAPATGGVFAIALTGYAQPEDRGMALEAGFDAHLPKPPPLDELSALLRRAASRLAPDPP